VSGDIEQLTEQVRAGLAADEETARAATPGPWQARWVGQDYQVHGPGQAYPYSVAEWTYAVATWEPEAATQRAECDTADAEHIARHDPARVLARVAATRALLDEILAWEHERRSPRCCEKVISPRGNRCDCGRDARVLGLLRHLAQPYQASQEESR
jgi:hypothetical protein